LTAHRLPIKCRNPEWLRKQYWGNQLSYNQLAKLCNCSASGIQYQMEKLGIPRRKQRDANARHVSLTTELQELLDGLLLGDGNLSSSRGISACFRLSDSSERYVSWIFRKLGRLGLETNERVSFNESSGAFHCRTRCYRELQGLYEKWYPGGKKKIPEDLQLKPNTVKYWYIGDGTYSKNSQVIRIAVIDKLLREGLPFLRSQLLNNGIGCTIEKYGLYIRRRSHQTFFNFILREEPEIPPGYDYKFPEEMKHG